MDVPRHGDARECSGADRWGLPARTVFGRARIGLSRSSMMATDLGWT
jgi:hypothetical protein